MPPISESTSAVHILESIRESISQPYCLIDEGGIVQDANQAFASVLGYKQSEIKGISFTRFVPEKLRPYAQTHHFEFFSQAHPAPTETWEYLDKAGNTNKFDVISSCVHLEKERRIKMIILTEAKQQEEKEPPSSLDAFKQVSRHMFKNTLQEMSGLLLLQASQCQGQAKSLLSLSYKRFNVIAFAYEQLYKYKNYEVIEVSLFLRKVLKFYQFSSAALTSHPEIYMKIDKCYALGLMLNDVLYASCPQPQDIIVQGEYQEGWYFLTLLYTGTGDRAEPKPVDTKLFNALQRQIRAQIPENSTENVFFELKVPL